MNNKSAITYVMVIGLLSTIIEAVEAKDVEPKNKLVTQEPEWSPLASSERTAILEMLSSHMKSNYERIRTWKGTCEFQDKNRLTPKMIGIMFRDIKGYDGKSPVLRIENGGVQFIVDQESKSLFTSFHVVKRRLKELDSGRDLQAPESMWHQRSIVTPEHYLNFQPDLPQSHMFSDLPAMPPGRVPTAFCDPVAKSKNQQSSVIIDPRLFFSTNAKYYIWEDLDRTISALRDSNPNVQKFLDSVVIISEAKSSGVGQYKVAFTGSRKVGADGKPDMSQALTAEAIYDEKVGFNPVSYYERDSTGRIKRHIAWKYENISGIIVPTRIFQMSSTTDGEYVAFERIIESKECKLNEPVDPSTFTYVGLGLKDGDRVVDRIQGIGYLMKDGQPQEVAKYGETPPPIKFNRQPNTGLKWIICTSLLVFFIAIFVARQYHKRRRMA